MTNSIQKYEYMDPGWLVPVEWNKYIWQNWKLITDAHHKIDPDSKVHGANMGPTWGQ